MKIRLISRLTWIVGVATLSRISLNTARRFAYPFAPALSRGLGVPLMAITSLIAINQATSVLGVLFGPFADRLGYRMMMLSGLGLSALGMLTGGIFPFYGAVMTALFLAGLGKSIFDPALQAYLGARVPYQRRGLVIGVTEFGWAGSALVGIPLIGLLISRFGWRAPFLALGGSALLGIMALGFSIPNDDNRTNPPRGSQHLWNTWRRLTHERIALGALGYGFFLSAANSNLFVVYGVWLEQAFNLSVVALGVSSTVIGMAELLGESLTASLSDRLGLTRSIIGGLIIGGLSYLGLLWLRHSLPSALVAIFMVSLALEFTVVTSLSFFTEILPDARATMMASFLAFSGIGRICGTLLGGLVWMAGGITAIGLVSACISCLALVSFVWGIRGWQPKLDSSTQKEYELA